MPKKDSFEKEVERAFGVGSPPRPVATFTSGTDGEMLEQVFGGRPWNRIYPTPISEAAAGDSLPFFTDEAFMYYLPALLVHVDRGSFDPNSRAPDNVYYILQHVELCERGSKKRLSKAQRELVDRILLRLKTQLDQL